MQMSMASGLYAVVVRESGSPVDSAMPDPLHAPYLGNVGYLSAELPRSAVYLGKGVVLTAFHGYRGRDSDRVWLLGREYAFDPKRTVRMRNPQWTGLRAQSDLALIRLKENPDLPELRLASRSPFGGERVILAGFGKVRDGGRTLLDSIPGYKTRVPGISPEGLATWGENLVEAGGIAYRTDGLDGDVLVFATVFDDGGALPLEAQADGGDSGGAVFVERGSGWELAGIIEAAGVGGHAHGTRIEGGAPFGAATYATDLTVYRDQILATVAVPEPAVGILLACAPVWRALRRRRRPAA